MRPNNSRSENTSTGRSQTGLMGFKRSSHQGNISCFHGNENSEEDDEEEDEDEDEGEDQDRDEWGITECSVDAL